MERHSVNDRKGSEGIVLGPWKKNVKMNGWPVTRRLKLYFNAQTFTAKRDTEKNVRFGSPVQLISSYDNCRIVFFKYLFRVLNYFSPATHFFLPIFRLRS